MVVSRFEGRTSTNPDVFTTVFTFNPGPEKISETNKRDLFFFEIPYQELHFGEDFVSTEKTYSIEGRLVDQAPDPDDSNIPKSLEDWKVKLRNVQRRLVAPNGTPNPDDPQNLKKLFIDIFEPNGVTGYIEDISFNQTGGELVIGYTITFKVAIGLTGV